MSIVEEISTQPAEVAVPVSGESPRWKLLARVFEALERARIEFCVTHGYSRYPHDVPADIDCVMPAEVLPRKLAEVLRSAESVTGAKVIQWLADGAHWIVLAGTNDDGTPCIMQLHVSPNYEMADRIFYSGREILRTRSRRGEFFIPATEIEFGCILVNRIVKGNLDDARAARLAELYAMAPGACSQQIARFFDLQSTGLLSGAAESGDWTRVREALPALRKQLLSVTLQQQRPKVILRKIARWRRKIARWIRPTCGLHVVFLGPDGVGKSTSLEAVREHIAPAFLRNEYQTFARSLLANKPKPGPHALPPRSFPASLLKAAWWLNCYTLGWFKNIRPVKARCGLVINHRYLLDAIVDTKRYRYSGPVWLLKMIWNVAPKPDVVILLDAPVEVIQKRKQEQAFEETARQRNAYLALVKPMSFGHIIDAAQPLEGTVADIDAVIISHLRARYQRQMGFARS